MDGNADAGCLVGGALDKGAGAGKERLTGNIENPAQRPSRSSCDSFITRLSLLNDLPSQLRLWLCQ